MGHNFAEINLWGTHIASVEWQPEKELAYFEYTQDFISSGIELSPLMMPLSSKIFSFPALARETFSGLPGLLADSLPDKFGNLLIDQWLSRQGRSKADFNPVERLCYVGLRAIGALEYKPNLRTSKKSESLELDYLVILANQVLRQKESLQIKSSEEQAIEQILQVGTSAGGARAKALIAWNSETDEVRSGQVDQDEGFSYWLLKFDGIDANSDKEAIDPKGYGLIEYAYYLMARDAGLDISESRLYEENGRQHFMTKRFDRSDSGAKLHQLSLMGMAHFDFNQVGAYSYEQVFEIIDKLNLGMASKEQFFRRMAFNIIARNPDKVKDKLPKTLKSKITLTLLEDELSFEDTAILINSTPVGQGRLSNSMPVSDLQIDTLPKDAIVYDLIYSETLFLKTAHEKGLTTIDGSQMLILQGVKSLSLWTEQNITPELIKKMTEAFNTKIKA